MADLPAGYQVRAPTWDDLEPVARVLTDDQLADGIEPTLDAFYLRQVWSRPDVDLATGAWVVTDDAGTIVAYGQLRPQEPGIVNSWGVVHPDQRGRGIGSALFDRIEARAEELLAPADSPRFRHSINARDAAAAGMAGARGLRLVRHNWHMQLDVDGPIEPVQDPPGITVATIEPPGDLRTVHAIIQSAFAEDPWDHPEPFDQWADEHVTSPGYDPSLWLLAREGDLAVGALVASVGDGGWVDWLAVLPSHRGRGIGLALLHRSFAGFAARGMRRVTLNVDAENVTGATALYERAGMRVVNAWDLWER